MRMTALLLGALLAITAGCGSSPKPRYYTLSADAPVKPERVASSARPSIGIAAVTIPDAVDRPQLVVGIGNNEIEIAEYHRWAGPLKRDLPWVIAENLARLLDNPRVAAYPQSAALDADYRITLDFRRIEARLGKEAAVEVSWTIRSSDGSERRSGNASVRQSVAGLSHDALVAGLSQALLHVSGELARDLGAMPVAAAR